MAVQSAFVSAVCLAGITVAGMADVTAVGMVVGMAVVTAVCTAEGMAVGLAGITTVDMIVGSDVGTAGLTCADTAVDSAGVTAALSSEPSLRFEHLLKWYYANENSLTYLGNQLE